MVLEKENVSHLAFLKCSACGRRFDPDQLNTFCSCENNDKNPLVASYSSLKLLSTKDIDTDERSMWRYAKVLPVKDRAHIVSLGEGWTPLIKTPRLASALGVSDLSIKDESFNPTNSFKARGLSAAVSKASELGIKKFIIPTAGNAGGALAAYCAHAGLQATVVMPRHTPQAFKMECMYFGASVVEVDGLINDCAKKVAELNQEREFFDVSTMKEPYRLEGKKTMGYEIAEQQQWCLPDVILYPTGGGTGLLGMWKAFHEMKESGWISGRFPRMIAVQTENCRPVVDDMLGMPRSPFQPTIANGLAVPFPFAHKMIQQVIKESGGTAITVSESEIIEGVKLVARREGMFVAPEGGALAIALKKLVENNVVSRESKILLLNTGGGYKYLENI